MAKAWNEEMPPSASSRECLSMATIRPNNRNWTNRVRKLK